MQQPVLLHVLFQPGLKITPHSIYLHLRTLFELLQLLFDSCINSKLTLCLSSLGLLYFSIFLTSSPSLSCQKPFSKHMNISFQCSKLPSHIWLALHLLFNSLVYHNPFWSQTACVLRNIILALDWVRLYMIFSKIFDACDIKFIDRPVIWTLHLITFLGIGINIDLVKSSD
jgi:hypothetical protein